MWSFAARMPFPQAPSLESMPLTREHTDVSYHVVAVAAVPLMVLLATATVLLLLPLF